MRANVPWQKKLGCARDGIGGSKINPNEKTGRGDYDVRIRKHTEMLENDEFESMK